MQWLSSPTEMIKDYFSRVGANPTPYVQLLTYPLSYVLPLLKKIKIFCHHNFDIFGACVRYFVDLDSLSGVPPGSIRSKSDNPQAWLTDMVNSEYDRTFWCDQFEITFGQFTINCPSYIPTLREFIRQRWLWVTGGATKFSKLTLDDKVVRTKFGAAVSLSDQELDKMVDDAIYRNTDDQHMRAFVKTDEASYKSRLIMNVPLGYYLVAAYIRYILSLFMGLEPGFEKLNVFPMDTIDVINLLRQGRVAYPLDESAYDYHVTRSSWLGFFDFLERMFPQNEGVFGLRNYFNHAIWEYDGQQGRWLKGMPSGLALTTLLNSWMNYIKQKTIVQGDLQWACGDDVLVFPYSDTDLRTIEKEYARFGSEANASKNWRSVKFCEYLKVLYGRYGTSGYPARIYGSLLFNIEEIPVNPNEKLYELVDLWKLFFDRMGVPMDEDEVTRDLARSVSRRVHGFSAKIAKLWLHSPKIHGGFGKLPYNKFTFTWRLLSTKVTNYVNSRYRLPRVVQYYGPVELEIGKYKLSSSQFRFGPSAKLPPINNEDDWVRRLNREDLPDRGPFTSMVLDQIPLPVIDFVGVANMSKMAQMHSFNVLPNLKGNWNAISSRLINGSLLLAQTVTNFMSLHKLSFLV